MLLVVTCTHIAQSEPTPVSLSLEQALQVAEENGSPLVDDALYDQQIAQANHQQQRANGGASLNLETEIATFEPSPVLTDSERQETLMRLTARRNLVDFGASSQNIESSRYTELASTHTLFYAQQERRLKVMEAFFDVLLADLAFARDNEAMANSYVRYDRLKARHELKQVSDLELSRSENLYHQSRERRYLSETQQRLSRSKLAIAMNTPGKLASLLTTPEVPHQKKVIPEFEQALEIAKDKHPLIQAQKAITQSAKARLQSARSSRWPTLDAEAMAGDYSRQMGNREPWRVGIKLRYPLYDAGSTKATVDKANASYKRELAKLRALELDVEQALLEKLLTLGVLYAQKDERQSYLLYRELETDKARAEYELEFTTELGSAMALQTDSQYRAAKTEFEIALTWAALKLMQGEELP
ncbi:MAG: TolC family protein [Gammaproteobacteria bacterium]|nr:TolC family protein [Gammaproteobacteria bacterium]